MRCLIIGCGSIGSRRARILAEMGHEVLLVDADDRVEFPLARELDARAMGHVHAGLYADPEAVFVCTPPVSHVGIARQVLSSGVRGLFVEKPLALRWKRASGLVRQVRSSDTVTMGACNMRFDERLPRLRRPVAFTELTMRQHAKHWSAGHHPLPLPLDSIHEWDLAVWLAGPIEDVLVSRTTGTDEAMAVICHDGGCTTVIRQDRVTDPPERWAEIDGHIHELWPPDEDMYRREMAHFLECVEAGEETCNPIPEAAQTLRWALLVCGMERPAEPRGVPA